MARGRPIRRRHPYISTIRPRLNPCEVAARTTYRPPSRRDVVIAQPLKSAAGQPEFRRNQARKLERVPQ